MAMSSQEITLLSELTDRARRIQMHFVEEGYVYYILRQQRLYRETHANFETFCEEVLLVSKRHADRLISAASAFYEIQYGENIDTNAPASLLAEWDQMVSFSEDMPISEAQIRPLTYVTNPEDKQKCWQEIIRHSHDTHERVTMKMTEEFADKYISKPKTKDKTIPSINAEFVAANPAPKYIIPDHKKNSGEYSGMYHAMPTKLLCIIGSEGLALWTLLNAHALGKNTVSIEDAALLNEWGVTRKTLSKHREAMVKKHIIRWDEKNTYTLLDINWILRAYNLVEDYTPAEKSPEPAFKFDSLDDVQPKQLVDMIDYIDSTLPKSEQPDQEQINLALAFALLYITAGGNEYWKGERAKGKAQDHQLKEWTKPYKTNKERKFYQDFRDWLKRVHRERVNGKPLDPPKAQEKPYDKESAKAANAVAMAKLKRGEN